MDVVTRKSKWIVNRPMNVRPKKATVLTRTNVLQI